MNIAIVSAHLPEPEGTAAGRVLLATAEGLLDLGHRVRVWSWRPAPPESGADLPSWCTWSPPRGSSSRVRSVLSPRTESATSGFAPGDDEVVVADEFLSFAATASARCRVVTLHYSTSIDCRALGRRTAQDVQNLRAENRAVRAADLVLAYSPRVAGAALVPARFVPVAVPVPVGAVPPVEEPVAAVLADWTWPPNRAALDALLGAWPLVGDRVPGARLRLAGRGLEAVGQITGVEVLGTVRSSADVLAGAAVVPFPVPPTSGPKVKVLEALAHGIPVVTTGPGAEGLCLPDGAGVVRTTRAGLADDLASVLADPVRRASLGVDGRAAVLAAHAPRPAAAARVEALAAVLAPEVSRSAPPAPA